MQSFIKNITSVSDARNNLAEYIDRVQKGSHYLLTNYGRPVAVLLSAEEYEKLRRKASKSE